MSTVRVFVVEDYKPFQQFICSELEKRPELLVIGRVADGLEAVQTAEKLQPDLIVLDVGLPSLNGIEVARQIRKLSTKSKILFVSQESSADLVQEALRLGALGYIVKTDAGSELLAAVEAVLQGRQYLSRGLLFHSRTDATNTQAIRSRAQSGTPLAAVKETDRPRSHEVAFCSDDESFVVGTVRFIEAALEAESAVIVIATASHRKSLLLRLLEHGVDVAAAAEQGRYVSLDVAETLSTFMVNDLPDPARCLKVAGDLVTEAAKAVQREPQRVAVFGECAPILWAHGKADAAVQVEHLWDEIARTHNVDILCAYVLNSFQREQESDIYERICAEHFAVSFR